MNHSGLLYWAYPIDQASTVEEIGWFITDVQVKAAGVGFGLSYDPGDAFNVTPGTRPNGAINAVNMAALDEATAMIAFVVGGVASVGVPREIEHALNAGIPLMVITDKATWALPWETPLADVRVVDGWRLDPATEEGITAGLVGLLREATGRGSAPGEGAAPLAFRRHHDGPWDGQTVDCAPQRAYPDDAGYDLVVAEDTTIMPGQFVDIPCGIDVELPAWSWAMLTGRSSTLRKRGLMVNPGIIDAGYRGPLFAGAFNLGAVPVRVAAGERVAQLIIIANSTALTEPVERDRLSDHPRGQRGFGSSGV